MRKFLAVIMTLALMLSGVAFAEAELSKDIVILYTNDVHTYIDGNIGYDVIANVKAQLQEKYEYVILADAGDHAQGT
ncbi:MAG: bifunctional metallophosphatase/5'-nucleotidase, partial [Clostridia bacterium]|nr:bifunctional metallophosphatase/5'-nucleotidase [Clostridia bacterium]